MFCNQCEQTAQGVACTTRAVCGKGEDVAALQDLLTNALRGLAPVALEAGRLGIDTTAEGRFTADALFTTLTNVDFDAESVGAKVEEAVRLRDALKAKVVAAGGSVDETDLYVTFQAPESLPAMVAEAEEFGMGWDHTRGDDIRSLQEITLYGMRGIGAYAHHAAILGQEDAEVYAYLFKALAAMSDTALGVDEWVGLALEAGKANLRTMELLDAGNTGTYGHPEPTKVTLGHRAGKAILISGHDLKDLELILEQTEGTGISVYTHGEMLPGHAYPGLKKYPHLAGHYGTGWQNQLKEFAAFPGAILLTTNCLMPPRAEYIDRVFTSGPVQFPGVQHLEGRFAPLIEKALAEHGFAEDTTAEAGSVMVGFGRNTVLSVAPQVIDAVKQGAIKHFFLVGGCDGAKPGRNYYTEFVESTPDDTIVLTLACGKFRFFDKDLGEIGGIPRLLDVGQCNDAYSAIQVAVALADAFGVGVNDLPLSLVLSWYEQKAVAILLTLLYLDIKGIRLGPTLPAFVSPNVLNVLVENFDIKPIGESAQADIEAILGATEVA
ncbi:MAG: hydroxylamine reductase [Coriobacteriales bacterium]|nr:hydroxylamine reductase [Coriobacteriales bacterium]